MNEVIKRLKEKYDAGEFKMPALAEATGIPANRIHKWIQGHGNPKVKDHALIEQWLDGTLQLVPRETSGKPEINGSVIAGLVESNRMLAEANLNYSIANKTLAENTQRLINRMDNRPALIERDLSENLEAVETLLGNVQEVLFGVALGKRYKNRAELEASLYRGGSATEKTGAKVGTGGG